MSTHAEQIIERLLRRTQGMEVGELRQGVIDDLHALRDIVSSDPTAWPPGHLLIHSEGRGTSNETSVFCNGARVLGVERAVWATDAAGHPAQVTLVAEAEVRISTEPPPIDGLKPSVPPTGHPSRA
jgi:hypothetical protein